MAISVEDDAKKRHPGTEHLSVFCLEGRWDVSQLGCDGADGAAGAGSGPPFSYQGAAQN